MEKLSFSLQDPIFLVFFEFSEACSSYFVRYLSLFPIDPKVFGCTCFVRDVRPQVFKLDSKSLKCIFVGYSRVQKWYRCLPHFPFRLLLQVR